MTERPQKVTFGEMRATGVRGVLISYADYECSHWIEISADQWPEHIRPSDLEPRFVCTACGQLGADVRPNLHRCSRSARTLIRLFNEPNLPLSCPIASASV